MARLLTILRITIFLLLLSPVFPAEALSAYRFQPLKDTLQAYGLLKIPTAADYPDVPAVAILSLQEYKQNGNKHTRRYHKIVKILTSNGKDYANLHIPCFSTCHVEARTIKANGKIINLPSKDLHRNQNLSGYNSPFFVAQFAMPGVEAGDTIEYVATVEYPIPFLMEDFRFLEPYPLLRGVLTLIHPAEDGYAYTRYSPPGGPAVTATQSRIVEGQNVFSRTMFVVEDVRPGSEEISAPEARQDVPGVRLIVETRSGRRLDIFKDWQSYGSFINSLVPAPSILDRELVLFVQNATANLTEAKEMIRAIYTAAEKRTQITDDTLWMSGFEFRSPEKVFSDKIAAPHDFALFLATCFKVKRWSADLVLVNSHRQTEAAPDRVFPLDLDLVFLNVKTPVGEFVLDCSRNALPALQLSSAGMNRFALGIPLFAVTTRFTKAGSYISRTTYRQGNRNHMEIVAIPGSERWELEFQWTLAGEFQSEWLSLFRKKGEAELQKQIFQKLRSRFDGFDFRDLKHSFKDGSFHVTGRAARPRRQLDDLTEVFQNEIWDSGFTIRPYIFENRVNRLLLPGAGEISSTLHIRSIGSAALLPSQVQIESAPVKYSLSFQKQNEDVIVQEKLAVTDMEVKQKDFGEFTTFLNQYYEKHFWAILIRKQ